MSNEPTRGYGHCADCQHMRASHTENGCVKCDCKLAFGVLVPQPAAPAGEKSFSDLTEEEVTAIAEKAANASGDKMNAVIAKYEATKNPAITGGEAGPSKRLSPSPNNSTPTPPTGTPEAVTRLTIVDWRKDGAQGFEVWDVKIKLDYQDDGRTLKVFIEDGPEQGGGDGE